MTYSRVVPRDLFNEANLLKCLGQLVLRLETAGEHRAALIEPEASEPFDIGQNPDTGGLMCWNVGIAIKGERALLERPLNSREPWPLYMTHIGIAELDEPVEVFTAEGELTDAFLAAIGALEDAA